MKLVYEDKLAAVVVGAEAALAGLIWRFGKAGPLPMHYDMAGHVNRWGDRGEAALMALAGAAITALAYLALPLLARPRNASKGAERALPYAKVTLLVAFALISLLGAAIGFGLLGPGGSPLPLVMAFVSLLMLAMGFFMGKVEPNPLVGVRTYWSLRSRLAWDKSNRLFGRVAFWTGVAGLLAFPITPQPAGLLGLLAATMIAAVASIFESWRVWRTDPDATTA